MGTIKLEELRELEHFNAAALDGRTIRMIPVWDGADWTHWLAAPDGRLIKMKMVDAAHSHYLTKVGPANESDLRIPLVHFVWQRLGFSELIHLIDAIEDDFHLLATSAAKLEHLHATRGSSDDGLVSSFVRSEIEYMLIVARSVFDLLQEIIAGFWNGHVKLLDDPADALKKRNRLPPTFAKVVFAGGAFRSAQKITAKFALPPVTAEQYERHAPFFASLRTSRDRIIHGSSSVGTIFVTEKGFAVSPDSKLFGQYPWKKDHYYNENIVSLMPWVASIVLRTIEACSSVVESLSTVIQFPEELAPGYHVLLRDPANPALLRLLEAANGKRVWWNTDGGQPASSSPLSNSN